MTVETIRFFRLRAWLSFPPRQMAHTKPMSERTGSKAAIWWADSLSSWWPRDVWELRTANCWCFCCNMSFFQVKHLRIETSSMANASFSDYFHHLFSEISSGMGSQLTSELRKALLLICGDPGRVSGQETTKTPLPLTETVQRRVAPNISKRPNLKGKFCFWLGALWYQIITVRDFLLKVYY